MQTTAKSSTGTERSPEETAEALSRATSLRPALAVVLGSGFGPIAEAVQRAEIIPYADLPGFAAPTAVGHAGRILVGELANTQVMVLSGRAHYYEGHPMQAVTFPMRVLAAFGVEAIVLTNAAGGINKNFRKGDFMLIQDHINLMGDNPLRGPVPKGRERFVDMTQAYDPVLSDLVRQSAKAIGVELREGVYLAVSGPNYETPAEIRAFAALGADAVGMSTVPEVLVARQCGMRVAGVSCISNLASGLGETKLTPDDVIATTGSVSKVGTALIENFANLYGKRS